LDVGGKVRSRLESHRDRDGRRSGKGLLPLQACRFEDCTNTTPSSSGLSRGYTAVDDCWSHRRVALGWDRLLRASWQILWTSPRITVAEGVPEGRRGATSRRFAPHPPSSRQGRTQLSPYFSSLIAS